MTESLLYRKMTLNINGVDRMFICDPKRDRLSDVLRRLGLTGVKVGCGSGVCGSCSVILNDKVVRSCAIKITAVPEYSTVLTIEGIGTPQHLHPLQVAWMHFGAVQCGFCAPGFIVSAFALLQQNISPSREEVRDWFQAHRNACRCTGYKQIVDAVMAAAKVLRGECAIEDIKLPLPADKDYYSKSLVRPAALGKVTGLTDYGDDIELKMPAETLHVALVQPKIAFHAKIKSIDYAEAEKMPGVFKVITAKDVRGTNRLNMFQFIPRCTALQPTHVLLAEDKIFNYGDVVAMVAADTKAHARAAAAAVKVEIEQLPEYLNYLDAVLPDSIRIHDDTPNIFALQPVIKGEEDLQRLFETADYVVEGSFRSSREPHMPIEGDTVQAYWGDDGMLTVQCKAMCIYFNATEIATATGVPVEKVRVIQNPTGSTFGWGTSAPSYSLAAIAAVACDRPIALHFAYEEFMAFSGKRAPSYSNGRLACDKDGKIIAAEFDTGLDHGAYEELGDDLTTRIARFTYFPYFVPNVAGLARVANTNHAFACAYRGYGSPQAYTHSEAMMDMMAEKIGMDPFDIRYINVARPGQQNLNRRFFRDYPMEKIMDLLRPLYEKAKEEAKARDMPQKRRGVGIAWGGYNVTEGTADQCTVALELNPDNTITKYDTWQDQGQGGDVGSLQVTLKALAPLGLTPDQIILIQNDNKYCPDSGSTASSRSHYMNGKASLIAADKLLTAMRKPDGSYRTYNEMTAEQIPVKYFGQYENPTDPTLSDLDPNTGEGEPTPAYTYALFMAEVEVDTASGKTTVLKYTCVADVGVIGDYNSVAGQAYGGISHSIGFALKENYDDVKKHNNILGAGIPYIKDIPDDIRLIFHVTPRDNGPWGSSGAAECFQSGGHMAVINAINNACGVRIYELPALPEKVKAGLDILAQGGKIEPPPKYFLGSDLHDELENIKNNPL
ncbi:MAG: molybdopterin-dependent oxidoreductase [Clostridia bacterium]|nr:molybdopterin-dependent oxidoreductase [Clostridia bacterium]